ncbi:thiamine pyrophosphate-dependent dehydrogenase E1 component subunit alpha [Aquibacillus sp. 3ASR75-11]|uniref:Thiamine pyrophosphate-dependent dehydrogenase E1 component subunit alpha n=1 Tax=Terrihalobacillus insolitus TaxID=2950438 RepID=A0A9X3WTQ0_9BACI|nr:thiamine pyrophosphate-dependent dehydrogenase E1 component subunit alpha [Terrihalobacillus insolitus]MDC3412068.1 thiamine pyrophosphate-dependent dehydrogenase E1 component subunit alpha [Terrihalobacillus insolitus]MDC3423239.1 thiamine pyrophosphate-dependent dehydrogenase E1 component subunit alpha [Terrihalobacillus insolitus]
MTISKEKLLWMYETMYKIRYYEDSMVEAYSEGKKPVFNIGAGTVPGEMHLATGQEPAAVGICAHLTKDDTVTAPHRPHHHAIAKGIDLDRMTAEIFGKETGLGKGKGGHMHLFDPNVKFSCGGIVAAGIPQAVGAALVAKQKKKDWVAVAFIGEGAANAGAFHESLNLASLWKLPLIIVVENNSYGISVPKESSTSISSNDKRAAAYEHAEGYYVKDNDPLEMYKTSEQAVERARRGEGPSIIEIETYRYLGHFQGDPELYRDKEEVPSLREKDPIERLKQQFVSEGIASEEEISDLESNGKNEVDKAYHFARESAYPRTEAALEDLYC